MRASARTRHGVPVLYKISTVVDLYYFLARAWVPVLYKISTVVDVPNGRKAAAVPVLYKISTLSVSASAAFSLSTRASASPSAAPG